MLILAVWYAGIACKGAAACRMAMNGLFRRFPLVFCYLAFCTGQSSVLAFLWTNRPAYAVAHAIGVPFGLLLQSAAIVSIFWALSANCPNFRKAGSILLNGLGVAGVGAAWLTAFVTKPVSPSVHAAWLWEGVQLLRHYVSIAQAVVLVGAILIIPRSVNLPLPKGARRAALILCLDAVLTLMVSSFTRAYAYKLVFVTQLIQTGSGLILGLLWLFFLTADNSTEISPRPPDHLDRDDHDSTLRFQLATRRFADTVRSLER